MQTPGPDTRHVTLTWAAAVPQLVEQRQALLLRPVVDDSGQDVQVSRRNVLLEEITCRAQWNSAGLLLSLVESEEPHLCPQLQVVPQFYSRK